MVGREEIPGAGWSSGEETYYDDSWSISLKGDRIVEIESRKRLAHGWPPEGIKANGRGTVLGFSPRSAGRMRDYLLSSVAEYRVMVTLTLPVSSELARKPLDAKHAFRLFVQRILRKLRDIGDEKHPLSIFWFMEFTKAGVVHFHFYLTHYIHKGWVAQSWYEVCGTGEEKHLLAGTRVEAIRAGDREQLAAYAFKYACKKSQKELPPGVLRAGRWWGIYGCRRVVAATIIVLGQFPAKDSPAGKKLNEFYGEIVRCLPAGSWTNLPLSPDYPGVHITLVPSYEHRETIYKLLLALGAKLVISGAVVSEDTVDFWRGEGDLECL